MDSGSAKVEGEVADLHNKMSKHFGLEWAPLSIPWQRRFETLTVLHFVFIFAYSGLIGFSILLYLFGWTKYGWAVCLAYVLWRLYDHETPKKGGRPLTCARGKNIWHPFAEYFPGHMEKVEDLDPKKNYILGCHPHGIVVVGTFGSFVTDAMGFSAKFPGIKRCVCTLTANFFPPIMREYLLSLGAVDCSKESIRYILTEMGTGNAVVIVVGGAQEALDARPGSYHLTLLKRKGFVKLALTCGADLVPVYCFGENDVYVQIDNPAGSKLRRFQEAYKRLTGFTPPIFHGRGIFNYTFGLLPFRKPLTVIVGKPIPVEKVESPTTEQIETLHKKYMDGLSDIFEQNKHRFNISEHVHLEFE